ncbi:hypothetical protein AXF42_Ash000093 [Apostasia shenzhenica]|uniref:Uncharacterized protein n=1 Tax=Apostasia shenzhenica TaxID=1088818 RepID=A0A2I0AFC9_9ASPA|nr:hypothetical protein AXF42_Ash000093 [Apostasia shenzhenica]
MESRLVEGDERDVGGHRQHRLAGGGLHREVLPAAEDGEADLPLPSDDCKPPPHKNPSGYDE